MKKNFLILVSLILLSSFTALFAQALPTGERLKDICGSMLIGFHFSDLKSDTDKTILLREANAGQPTWFANWGGWTAESTFNFTTVNSDINWLYANQKKIVVHMFVGDSMYLPTWLSNGTFTTAKLDSLLKYEIKSVILSNNNNTKVDMWNVVNECIKNEGGWTPSKFKELGYEADASGLTGNNKVFDSIPVYVRKAFEYARLYTNKDLELRDYVNDASLADTWIQTKTKAFYQLTKHLIAKGAPITAVGFQGHISPNNVIISANISAQVQKFKALGLKVFVTEFDCNGANATTQASAILAYVQAVVSGGVDGIFFWGVRDNQDLGWKYGENALTFTEAGTAKASHYALQQVLKDSIVQTPTKTGYKINCGGSAILNFSADEFFSGATTFSNSIAIDTTGVVNAGPSSIYNTERYGDVTYTFPNLVTGTYTVRLHFCETFCTAIAQRKFDVTINGTKVLSEFDIFATAGANKACVKSFVTTTSNNKIIIDFANGSIQNASIKGIEIIAGNATKTNQVFTSSLSSFNVFAQIKSNGINFNIGLEQAGKYQLSIFDVRGVRIWNYNGIAKNKGQHNIKWNKSALPSNGTYVVVLKMDNKQVVKKSVLIR